MYDPSRDPRLFERRIDANGDEYKVMLPPPPRGKPGFSQSTDPSFAGSQRRNTPPPYTRAPYPSGPRLVGEWNANLLLEIRYLGKRAVDERWEEWDPQWPRRVIQFLGRLIGDGEAGAYKCEVWNCDASVTDTKSELWTWGYGHVHVTPDKAKQMIETARRAMPRNWARVGTASQIIRFSGVNAPQELQIGKADFERKDWYPYPALHKSVSARSDRRASRPPPPHYGANRLDALSRTVPPERVGEDDEDFPRRGIPYFRDEVGDAHFPRQWGLSSSNNVQYGPREGYVGRPMSPPSANPRPNIIDPRLRGRRPKADERDQLTKTKDGRVEKPEKGMSLDVLEKVLPKLRSEATEPQGDQPANFFTANLGFRPKNKNM